jgi:hypothetical protein
MRRLCSSYFESRLPKMIALGALTLLVTLPLHAEPLKPGESYSEARLEKIASSGAAKSAEYGLAAQPTTWVKSKLSSLTGWGQNSPDSENKTAKRATASIKSAPQTGAPTGNQAGTQGSPATGTPGGDLSGASAAASAAASASANPLTINPSATAAGNGMSRSVPNQDSHPNATSTATAATAQNSAGVPVFELGSTPTIPRLNLPKEEKLTSSRWALDPANRKPLDQKVIHALDTPELLLTKDLRTLLTSRAGAVDKLHDHELAKAVFGPKGKVSRAEFDKIVIKPIGPMADLKLAKFTPLTESEVRFLSGLLLYQQGDKCAAAVGLFHQLAKNKAWQSEADYYLAMCSRKLGLESDFIERARRILISEDTYYIPKILKEVGTEIPYETTDAFGLALQKVAGNDKLMAKLDATTKGNVAFLLAQFGASSERFKTALQWAKKVPADNPKYLQARFIEALGEYQSGSKAAALKIQEDLIGNLKTDKANQEFQALVALNLARMYFQEKNFKAAHASFLRVYKDHPMWLQSLTELGWAQLMSGDFEGAIGNMYSIHSPFFAGAYKPESYVIRTIGYLNLCQYGDAYRTLSLLEHDYRPWLSQMESFTKAPSKVTYYQTVKDLIAAQKLVANEKDNNGPKEVDGLPVQVIREMARHRDFTNLQHALNRQLDEKPNYERLEADVAKGLEKAQWLVNSSRKRSDDLRRQLASIKANPQLEKNRNIWQAELNHELEVLNDHFFDVDLYNEASSSLAGYKAEIIKGADVRIVDMRNHIEKLLKNRMLRMKTDLARALDNNELLRYEVFSGSGENIRYQVAGGEQGNRVPASLVPKSKSLQWDFDGEYWEDEIGHYRSSLKNNCPSSSRQDTASLGGDSK